MQRDSGRGLLTVINDILDFSKIDDGRVTIEQVPFSLHDALRGCMELFADQARLKGLDLTLSVAPGAPAHVLGDSTRLRQVLLNLVGNAVKFTEAGSVRVIVAGDTVVPDGIRFSVVDTGIGIEAPRIASLFERFTQADSSTTRQYGGTGLGLAISKALVELMGGALQVESTPGLGSTFFFVLALQAVDPSQAHPTMWGGSAAPGLRYRILLAEDNEASRELIAAMLEQAGHEVIGVSNGLQAVDAAAMEKFDAILMDVQMPEMDGY